MPWSEWIKQDAFNRSAQLSNNIFLSASYSSSVVSNEVTDPDTPSITPEFDTSAKTAEVIERFRNGDMTEFTDVIDNGGQFPDIVYSARLSRGHDYAITSAFAGIGIQAFRSWEKGAYSVPPGPPRLFNYWRLIDSQTYAASQSLVSFKAPSIPTYPEDGYIQYKSLNPIVTWNDWTVHMLSGVQLSTYWSPEQNSVVSGDVFLPPMNIYYVEGEAIINWRDGVVPGFFRDGWPRHSEMNYVGHVEFPQVDPYYNDGPGEYWWREYPRIMPLHNIPSSVRDFTLVLASDILNPTTTRSVPNIVIPDIDRQIYGPYPNGETRWGWDGYGINETYSDGYANTGVYPIEVYYAGTYSQGIWYESPSLRIQPPDYRYWFEESSAYIPPLRQRERNDGLTTDTRQERTHNPSPQKTDLWWIGRPGTHEGGST